MKQLAFDIQFVEFIPKRLEEGVLYISMPYATATHSCFCGCGMKVVTPLSPTDWTLTFDGDSISLDPSVGNWSYPCRSHYILSENRVIWAGSMSNSQIRLIRARDQAEKNRYYDRPKSNSREPQTGELELGALQSQPSVKRLVLWNQFLNWLKRVQSGLGCQNGGLG